MRLLIDECLSPELARDAQEAGFEAYHLVHLGRAGWQDWNIAWFAVDQDMILVTNNRADFRELYARHGLHPGLVIIVPSVSREAQSRLLGVALEHLRQLPGLVNKVLEATLDAEDVLVDLYDWPPAETE